MKFVSRVVCAMALSALVALFAAGCAGAGAGADSASGSGAAPGADTAASGAGSAPGSGIASGSDSGAAPASAPGPVIASEATPGSAPASASAPAGDQTGQTAETSGGSPSPTGNEETAYKKITAEEAKQLMKDTIDYILIDVRTESEYRERRLQWAILMPVEEILRRAEAELLDKEQIILVYCRSGVRSANAADMLTGLGYKNVYDLGGIIDWPFDTISG